MHSCCLTVYLEWVPKLGVKPDLEWVPLCLAAAAGLQVVMGAGKAGKAEGVERQTQFNVSTTTCK